MEKPADAMGCSTHNRFPRRVGENHRSSSSPRPSPPSDGREGARRAGEEASRTAAPMVIGKWYEKTKGVEHPSDHINHHDDAADLFNLSVHRGCWC